MVKFYSCFTSFCIIFILTDVTSGSTLVPWYRYTAGQNGKHFYSTSLLKKQEATDRGVNLTEIVGGVYTAPVTGTSALYRYRQDSTEDAFYTLNWGELGGGKINYVYEGIACYIFEKPTTGTVPIHRYLLSQFRHIYTTNWYELRGGGGNVRYEGVAGYVYPPQIDTSESTCFLTPS